MSRVDPSKFHYFSPVDGRVVSRYGSTGYVGARGPNAAAALA